MYALTEHTTYHPTHLTPTHTHTHALTSHTPHTNHSHTPHTNALTHTTHTHTHTHTLTLCYDIVDEAHGESEEYEVPQVVHQLIQCAQNGPLLSWTALVERDLFTAKRERERERERKRCL